MRELGGCYAAARLDFRADTWHPGVQHYPAHGSVYKKTTHYPRVPTPPLAIATQGVPRPRLDLNSGPRHLGIQQHPAMVPNVLARPTVPWGKLNPSAGVVCSTEPSEVYACADQ